MIVDDIRLKIAEFAELPYDWDGKGGLPIRGDVQTLAGLLFDATTAKALERAGWPQMAMLPNGAVELYFERMSRTLRLTVLCRDTATYVKSFGRRDARTIIEGLVRDPHVWSGGLGEINELLAWVAQS